MTAKEATESPRPLVHTGSLLNSSEGILSGSAMAALVQQMTTNDDWRVQAAACIGLAVVAATYAIVRGRAKAAG
jgi:hypothetical protein